VVKQGRVFLFDHPEFSIGFRLPILNGYWFVYVCLHVLILPRPPVGGQGCCSEYPLNNPDPSLHPRFRGYPHYYGLVRLPPVRWYCQRIPQTEIPCSAVKPNLPSPHLYAGGRTASRQVPAVLVSASFAKCDFARQLA